MAHNRMQSAMQSLYRALKSPRFLRVAWAVAIIIFFGGFAVSVMSRPELVTAFRLDAILIILLLLCPAMTLANLATTKETALLAGVKLSIPAALKLAVMSAAANHLPVPGGLLLRIAVIQAAGGSLKSAGLANVVTGVVWMSATFLFAGFCSILLDTSLSVALIGLGCLLFSIALGVARPLPGGRDRVIHLLLISLFSAGAYALSIYMALNAFGASWSFPQAAVIASAGVIGAASSITPSGLGVREAAAALLATLIGADPAAAFAATATVHIAMAGFTGVVALYFFVRDHKEAVTA